MREDLSTPAVLSALRVTLHVSFAALLVLAAVRAVLRLSRAPGGGAMIAVVLGLSVLLAAVYLAGTLVENRVARGRARREALRWGPVWLGLIAALWAALALLSPDFSWVAFPLFFLCPVVLPTAAALVAIVVLTGVVVLSQYLHAAPGAFTAGMALGPAIGAIVALLVSFGYRALYEDTRRHVRAIRDLESTRAELARQERDAGTMAERDRLSREIHDTLAQGLTSIVLVSRAAQRSLERAELDAARAQLAAIEDTAAADLAEARRFVRDLAAPAPGDSLPAVLAEVCHRTRETARAVGAPLTCEFTVEGAVPELPAPQRTLFVRAAQSTLANVTSHARASRAVVTLAGWDDAVTLDVVDDGAGFRPRSAADDARDDSFGLAHLRRRAHELGAVLTVESEPGAGTAVNLRLPLPAPEATRPLANGDTP